MNLGPHDHCLKVWLCCLWYNLRFSESSLSSENLLTKLPAQQLANSCPGTRFPRSWFMPIIDSPARNYHHVTRHPREGSREHESNSSSYFQISSPFQSTTPNRKATPILQVSRATRWAGTRTWSRATAHFPNHHLEPSPKGHQRPKNLQSSLGLQEFHHYRVNYLERIL